MHDSGGEVITNNTDKRDVCRRRVGSMAYVSKGWQQMRQTQSNKRANRETETRDKEGERERETVDCHLHNLDCCLSVQSRVKGSSSCDN